MIRHQRNSASHSAGKSVVVVVAIVLLIVVGVVIWRAASSGRFSWAGGEKELTLEEARATANPIADSPAAIAEAGQLYAELCEHCHGEGGAGDGGEAQMYTPPPADFTRPAMVNIRDGELFYRITEGRKPMPSFRRALTADQRWKLVRYIRTFAAQKHE
jgi:mono/diheme cytochrome c family protein